jgi:hypothetical protein
MELLLFYRASQASTHDANFSGPLRAAAPAAVSMIVANACVLSSTEPILRIKEFVPDARGLRSAGRPRRSPRQLPYRIAGDTLREPIWLDALSTI